LSYFSLEIAHITRVMPIKAKRSAKYGPPCIMLQCGIWFQCQLVELKSLYAYGIS